MKNFFKYIVLSFIFLILQGVIEVIVIVILEYIGLDVLGDFSTQNLVIENIEATIWDIFMKSIMFGFIYLPLFVGSLYLLSSAKKMNNFSLSVINFIINILLLIILFSIKEIEIIEIVPPLVCTSIASCLVFLCLFKFNRKGW